MYLCFHILTGTNLFHNNHDVDRQKDMYSNGKNNPFINHYSRAPNNNKPGSVRYGTPYEYRSRKPNDNYRGQNKSYNNHNQNYGNNYYGKKKDYRGQSQESEASWKTTKPSGGEPPHKNPQYKSKNDYNYKQTRKNTKNSNEKWYKNHQDKQSNELKDKNALLDEQRKEILRLQQELNQVT